MRQLRSAIQASPRRILDPSGAAEGQSECSRRPAAPLWMTVFGVVLKVRENAAAPLRDPGLPPTDIRSFGCRRRAERVQSPASGTALDDSLWGCSESAGECSSSAPESRPP